MIFLITGGSKCGKSSYAEKLIFHLSQGKQANYLATMRVASEEEEAIVRRHQEYRKEKNFIVHECPLRFPDFLESSFVLLEDLPNLLANHMFGGDGYEGTLDKIVELTNRIDNLVIVTNEVGSCILKYPIETENYIAALGRLNYVLAKRSDCVIEVVVGIPLAVKGVLPL